MTVRDNAAYVAGHSLGEYTALAAARAFTVADAARLLKRRGQAMQLAVPVGAGAMAALLGLELDAAREVVAGTDNAYAFAKKYKIKTAFGTDVLFSQALAEKQGQGIVDLTRWYTAAEALIMATSTNSELLKLSGPRNPYPGRVGVVEEGAFADLLLVDGNPLENIKLIAEPQKSFVVIMKDGTIHKNTLAK